MKKIVFQILAFCVFLACGLSLTSCSDTMEPDQTTEKTEVINEPGHLSIEDALANAEAFFAELDQTRSGRKVQSINILKRKSTRTEDNKTNDLLYLVNYSDNQGFALLGSDERMLDVYAISEEGHLELSDTIDHPALGMFIQMAEQHAEESLAQPYSLSGGTIGGTIVPNFKVETRITKKVKPLLPPNVTKWGQLYPFNKYCVLSNGKLSYPGCMAVAVGMILAYNRWPNSYSDLSFNWNEMIDNNNTNLVALFLKNIGRSDLLNGTYFDGACHIYENSIIPTFQKLGYSTTSAISNKPLAYNVTEMYNLIEQKGCPVMMIGQDPTKNAGHAWIVDGYIERRIVQIKSNGIVIPMSVLPTAIHIVWGWEGRHNGYFVLCGSSLSEIDGNLIDKEDYDNKAADTEHLYNYNIRFYGGYRPNK